MEGEVGLVAGRSQREKRRSYKDLLREEEEIDAQVRKTSKKRRDSDPFAAGNELHKKKKRTHEDENYHHKEKSHGQSLHHKKKKKKTTPEGRSSHMSHAHSSSTSSSSFMPSASHTASTETAMDLLQAITSPLATGSDPSPPHHQQHHHQPYKKSSNTTHSHHHHHHHTSSQRKQQQRGEDWDTPPHAARPRPPKKKPPLVRETLPVVGTEVELEGHYDGPMGIMGDSSSSAEELEDGELIIDDSYAQLAKKAKKSKKSKKKKEKEKDKEKEKERDKKHSQKGAKKVSKGGSSSHSSGMANGGAGYQFGMADSANHRQSDEKKKKEKKAKPEKDKKRRTITAYQVFCKEYRASINEEQPGLDFGELAKRLGDAWNQLPEGDKEVWKERAQYLQAKADLKSGMSSGKSVSQSSSSAAAKAEKPKAVKRVESRPVLLQTNGVSALEAESAPSPGEVPEVDPIDAAAHLQLLGESLSVIGCRLQETEGMVTVSGSLSVLLDAMLCALGPLACLTAQVPELNGCPQHILSKTLDNIAYVMPGL
ncbi:HMG box-containing protein 4-like [Engraulis encrasicolus]|uniref:HMG box-containing protein 4-like n=1 Tax=Engraulis encrasicolus TaxID=184585 RepID=UPI002FD6CC16